MTGYDEIPARGPIESLYAAIAVGPEGEGVVGVYTGEGWMPLVVSDKGRDLESVLAQCRAVCDRIGYPIRVVKFDKAGIYAEFKPGR